MSNNIDTQNQSIQPVRSDTAPTSRDTGQPQARGETPVQATVTDTVELTQAALRLKSLEVAVANLPEVDSDRVAAVRARIDSGDYLPDAGRIAERMLAFDALMPDGRTDGE